MRDDDQEEDLSKEFTDQTMLGSSNAKDTGKLSGYSRNDSKIKVIPETFSTVDADDYIKEIIDDYGTKDSAASSSNPGGIVLTKWNGERATRRFIKSAL